MGCEDYLVNALQVCQNKAARLVTKLDRFTPTKVLMQQCGWLSVKQLMIYHSLLHKAQGLPNETGWTTKYKTSSSYFNSSNSIRCQRPTFCSQL